MPDMAVLEPETETVNDAFDNAFADNDEGNTEPEQTAETVETPDQTAVAETEGDERKLPGWIKELKASGRMKEFREAKADWYGYRGMQEKLKDFDLDGTKAFFAEHGDRDSLLATLQEREEKAQELDAISEAINTGDPKVLDRIPAESLGKLAPYVVNQWAQKDGESYQRALSGIFAQTIAGAQVKSLYQDGGDVAIPVLFAEVRSALEFGSPEQAKVIASGLLTRMQEYLGGFGKAAAAPAQQRQSADPNLLADRQALETERDTMFMSGYRADVESYRAAEVQKGIESYLGRKLTADDAGKVEAVVVMIDKALKDRFKGDTKYNNDLRGHEKKRDKDGALRLLKSREGSALSDIVPKEARKIFGQPAPAKTTSAPSPKTTPRAPVATRPRDKFDEVWNRA